MSSAKQTQLNTIASDYEDDELEYALKIEDQIKKARSIYTFDSESEETSPDNQSSQLRMPTEAKSDADVAPQPPEIVDSELNELLPDLDLSGLDLDGFELSASTPAQSEVKPERESVDTLLPDLDLLGLFGEPLAATCDTAQDPPKDSTEIVEDPQGKALAIDYESLYQSHTEEDEDDSYWLEEGEANKEVTSSSLNDAWEDFSTEVDEYQEDIGKDEALATSDDTCISWEERALQAAIETGRLFNLSNAEVHTIAEIYEINGWSACKVAIERELQNDSEVDELRLATEVKEIWLEHTEFYTGSQTNYKVLSWPAALSIVRGFDGYPSAEEVEILLEELHDHWYRDRIAKKIYRHFGMYVISKFNPSLDETALQCEWDISFASHFDEDRFTAPSTCDIPLKAFLANHHHYFFSIRKISNY